MEFILKLEHLSEDIKQHASIILNVSRFITWEFLKGLHCLKIENFAALHPMENRKTAYKNPQRRHYEYDSASPK